MNSIELNDIITRLAQAVRKNFGLNVDDAVALVMLSSVANKLQSGALKERRVERLLASLVREAA